MTKKYEDQYMISNKIFLELKRKAYDNAQSSLGQEVCMCTKHRVAVMQGRNKDTETEGSGTVY